MYIYIDFKLGSVTCRGYVSAEYRLDLRFLGYDTFLSTRLYKHICVRLFPSLLS